MSDWTHAAVCSALGVETRKGLDDVVFTAVGTDTRALSEGALFVALRGDNHDAHAFLAQAADAGARGAVVEEVPADAPSSLHYYIVDDTLAALGRLARFHRRRGDWRVIAVAGANGKTTTKDLLRTVLGTRYRVHATSGNFNNLVGAPLTLLSAPAGTEVVVAEIGTNVPGEVAQLAAIVEPDAAVVTSIAAEHLEGLGDLDGVLREESSVLPWLPVTGVAVVPDDPAALGERARRLTARVIVVGGKDADADYRATDIALDDEGRVHFQWGERRVELRLRGRHNARNALLALAIGDALDVDATDAVRALAELEPAKMRMEFHQQGDFTVIADCYNSNPSSVDAAIDLLVSLPRGRRRVAVLGSMLELGPGSAQLHSETAERVAGSDVDLIVATGEFAAAFGPHASRLGDRVVIEADPIVAFEIAAPRLRGDEYVLLKGSRGVALERLLPRFEEYRGVLHSHGEAFGSRAINPITDERDDAPSAEHSQTLRTNRGEA